MMESYFDRHDINEVAQNYQLCNWSRYEAFPQLTSQLEALKKEVEDLRFQVKVFSAFEKLYAEKWESPSVE